MTILILSLIIAGLGAGGFFWIKGMYKKVKSLNRALDSAQSEIHSLRDQIVEMVELQGDKNDVRRKTRKGKKDIDTVSDDKLSIDYSNKLHNVPTRKDRKK